MTRHTRLVSSALASCCHEPPPITSSSLVQVSGQLLFLGAALSYLSHRTVRNWTKDKMALIEPVTRSRLGDFNHTVLALFCIVMVLLALAGDVHPNPGPGLSECVTSS